MLSVMPPKPRPLPPPEVTAHAPNTIAKTANSSNAVRAMRPNTWITPTALPSTFSS
jgi:hypothetical protein